MFRKIHRRQYTPFDTAALCAPKSTMQPVFVPMANAKKSNIEREHSQVLKGFSFPCLANVDTPSVHSNSQSPLCSSVGSTNPTTFRNRRRSCIALEPIMDDSQEANFQETPTAENSMKYHHGNLLVPLCI